MASRFYYLLVLCLVFTFSCSDDEGTVVDNTELAFENGYFIINEGAFSGGTGTLSFYDREKEEVFNEIFQANNNDSQGNPILLGNVVQSMSILNETAYVVVNNANKVVIVDLEDFSYQGEINDLILPRYLLPISNQKAYITQWGEAGLDGSIAVLNTSTNTISQTIELGSGSGPEKMHFRADDNKLFVAHNGGFGRDSVITIIDTNTDMLVSKIVVGDNPESVLEDKDGTIWVLTSGYYDFVTMESTIGHLVALGDGNDIIKSFEIPSGCSDLVIDKEGENLYFLSFAGIHKHPISANEFSTEPFIATSLYGLDIDPQNGNLLGADAGDFASKGMIHTYDQTGVLQNSIEVGVIPNGFTFE